MQTLSGFSPRKGVPGTQLTTYVMILGNVNSCVNPWIYVVFNRDQVRRAFYARRGHHDDRRPSSRFDGRSLTVLSSARSRNPSTTNSTYSMSMTTYLLPNDKRSEHHPLHRNSSQWSRRGGPMEWRGAREERGSIAQRYMVTAVSDISLNYIDSETTT